MNSISKSNAGVTTKAKGEGKKRKEIVFKIFSQWRGDLEVSIYDYFPFIFFSVFPNLKRYLDFIDIIAFYLAYFDIL